MVLVRQDISGVLQNMQHTVTVSWSAINGLTQYLKNADHERFCVYAEEIDKRSWFLFYFGSNQKSGKNYLFCSA
ncbi:MAG: hypothetical protein HFI72_07625 [Peptococcaceae bacterium]|jgi:hypothetical protein|nr:hypothetical protein [Peptococcaceae bacterium]